MMAWYIDCPPLSTFERMLDAKLNEEESTIPVLRPSPEVYR